MDVDQHNPVAYSSGTRGYPILEYANELIDSLEAKGINRHPRTSEAMAVGKTWMQTTMETSRCPDSPCRCLSILVLGGLLDPTDLNLQTRI